MIKIGFSLLLVLVLVLSKFLPGTGLVVLAADDEPILYGIQRYTGQIWEINPTDGTATLEFTVASPVGIGSAAPNGLAFDEAKIYWYYTTYSGQAKLYFWDGAAQHYAGLLTGEIACGDFYEGKYYYIAGGPAGATDDLYEVTFDASGFIASEQKLADISNNVHKWTFNGDIAISPDGVIYGVGACSSHSGNYEFFKVNRNGTGFQMIDTSVHNFSLQLAFGSDGTLYGHESRNDGPFFAVDLVNGDLSTPFPNATNYLYTDLSSGPRDPACGQLYVFKYNDLNRNGLFDGDDYGLEGWEFNLDGTQLLTGTNGVADFGCLASGNYTICETQKDGWVNSEPGGETLCRETEVIAGENVTATFGNYQLGKIKALKYYDKNLNGRNDDEPGLENWTICLNGNCQTTSADGYTEWWTVVPGTYTICETRKNGWGNSDPGDGTLCKVVTVGPGDSVIVEFGNYRYTTTLVGITINPTDKVELILPWMIPAAIVIVSVVLAAVVGSKLAQRSRHRWR